jgi:ATP-dependent Clp protease adapter protein ClpS
MELTEANTTQIINELHSRGYAVCIFIPEDVVSARLTRNKKKAADWLIENRRWVEEDMVKGGYASMENADAID